MKRNIIFLILTLILCMSLTVTAFAADGFVYDDADLLTDAEEAALESKLETISRTYNAQMVVFTVASADTADLDRFASDLYDGMGFGYGAGHDGVMLLVCMDPREYRILSNGFAADAIGSWEIDLTGEMIVYDLSNGDYADAFHEFADEISRYLDGHINGYPFNFGMSLVIALAVGLAAGFITAFVLKGQLKTVRQQHEANVYIRPGSLQITTHLDIFLYRTVTRTRRESDSNGGSSRSSGSSRNIGGGKF